MASANLLARASGKFSKAAAKWLFGVPAFLGLSVCAGLLGSLVLLPVVPAADTVADTAVEAFNSLPEAERWQPPKLAQKSEIYAGDGTLLATFFDENRIVVPLSEISENMQNAVVALEDKRFWEHGGIDMRGMVRAFVSNASNGDVQGASTLTQQYIKNVLIAQATADNDPVGVLKAKEVSYSRKLREAKLAITLEQTLAPTVKESKEMILEGYLNIAQFGPSLYGVEAAALYYFGVHAKDLNVVQSATIAAIAQRPNGLDPVNFPEANKSRRDACLKIMYDEGYITKAQLDQTTAMKTETTLNIHPVQTGCTLANDKAGGSAFFCDYVVNVIRNDPAFGETQAARTKLLRQGGLKVYTTLDMDLQAKANEAVEDTVPRFDPSGVGMALVSVKPGTGEILAMTQNRLFNPIKNDSENRETPINYSTDRDYGGSSGFQAGSTFKPIILAEWLESGKSLRDVFPSPGDYDAGPWQASCLDGGVAIVQPWHVGPDRGLLDAERSTYGSINQGYAAMEHELDLCEVADMIARLGIARADGQEWPIDRPSQVLGTNEVSPLRMATAFATFASGGTYCKPVAIVKVFDSDGAALPVPTADCNAAISSEVAAGVAYAMQKVITQGTGTSMNIGREAAGKTGTTNQNIAVWFNGYVPQLETAVWAGFPDESKPLRNVVVNGRSYSEVFGANLPGAAWKHFMLAALDGQEVIPFPDINPEILRGKGIKVIDTIGMTAEEAIAALKKQGILDVTIDPNGVWSTAVENGRVAVQNPGVGTEVFAGAQVVLALSKGPEPPPVVEPPPTTPPPPPPTTPPPPTAPVTPDPGPGVAGETVTGGAGP